MRNTIALAAELEFETVTAVATYGGSYLSAKSGFVPDASLWSGPMRASFRSTLLACSRSLPMAALEAAKSIIEHEDPNLIAALAELRDIVRIGDPDDDDGADMPLGYALLTRAPTWHGSRAVGKHEGSSGAEERPQ